MNLFDGNAENYFASGVFDEQVSNVLDNYSVLLQLSNHLACVSERLCIVRELDTVVVLKVPARPFRLKIIQRHGTPVFEARYGFSKFI
jgi:hypothetical protein